MSHTSLMSSVPSLSIFGPSETEKNNFPRGDSYSGLISPEDTLLDYSDSNILNITEESLTLLPPRPEPCEKEITSAQVENINIENSQKNYCLLERSTLSLEKTEENTLPNINQDHSSEEEGYGALSEENILREKNQESIPGRDSAVGKNPPKNFQKVEQISFEKISQTTLTTKIEDSSSVIHKFSEADAAAPEIISKEVLKDCGMHNSLEMRDVTSTTSGSSKNDFVVENNSSSNNDAAKNVGTRNNSFDKKNLDLLLRASKRIEIMQEIMEPYNTLGQGANNITENRNTASENIIRNKSEDDSSKDEEITSPKQEGSPLKKEICSNIKGNLSPHEFEFVGDDATKNSCSPKRHYNGAKIITSNIKYRDVVGNNPRMSLQQSQDVGTQEDFSKKNFPEGTDQKTSTDKKIAEKLLLHKRSYKNLRVTGKKNLDLQMNVLRNSEAGSPPINVVNLSSTEKSSSALGSRNFVSKCDENSTISCEKKTVAEKTKISIEETNSSKIIKFPRSCEEKFFPENNVPSGNFIEKNEISRQVNNIINEKSDFKSAHNLASVTKEALLKTFDGGISSLKNAIGFSSGFNEKSVNIILNTTGNKTLEEKSLLEASSNSKKTRNFAHSAENELPAASISEAGDNSISVDIDGYIHGKRIYDSNTTSPTTQIARSTSSKIGEALCEDTNAPVLGWNKIAGVMWRGEAARAWCAWRHADRIIHAPITI